MRRRAAGVSSERWGYPRPAVVLPWKLRTLCCPVFLFFFFLSSMDAGICQLCMLTSYQEKSVSCQFAISGFRPRRTEARAKFPSTRGLGTDPEGQRPGCQKVSSCRQGSRGNDSAAFICLGKGESNLKNQAPPLYVEGKHLQDTGQ